MGSSFENFTRWLLIAGLSLAAAHAAKAQHGGGWVGQAIIFSSADDDGVSSNMPSLAAKPPGMFDLANAVQSPGANSGAATQNEPPPEPPPTAISPAQVQQMRRLLDEQRNWALLTPEQILGMPTPEKALGISDRDAFGQPKNETVIAQYFKREQQSQVHTNIDNHGAANPAPPWDTSSSPELQMNHNIWAPADSKPGNPTVVDQFLNVNAANNATPAKTQQGGWTKSFNLPSPPPDPTPEQQAAMDQFRQLLQPRTPSEDSAKTPVLGSPIFSPSSTAQAPVAQISEPSPAIPIGASYAPLSDGIAMPTRVTPLPGLLGPTNAPVTALIPEWKPQPPPWMSSGPQLGVIPQRKF
jgi:hypothetical protein